MLSSSSQIVLSVCQVSVSEIFFFLMRESKYITGSLPCQEFFMRFYCFLAILTNCRLPALIINSALAIVTCRFVSFIFSLFISTPPCSMRRLASPLVFTISASSISSTIQILPSFNLAAGTSYTDMSLGMPLSLKIASNSSFAFLASSLL